MSQVDGSAGPRERPVIRVYLLDDHELVRRGTRDLLVPGCRLLARRAEEAGWDLSYVEEPDLIHVYPLVSFIPEARRAWRATREFLG